MFKLKSIKSMNKRFKFTGTSKLMRRHSHHSHLLAKKSSKQKKRLSKITIVSIQNLSNCKFLVTQKR
jgi:large subunit ribosomal protein L35|uniref:50S ribosomal protein L35 n=1 Tax=Thorea hispida TaxID=202687 RepID=A0A1C9CAA2_9FLOR|nr:ribosomal protein L35 [Thorea hispida]AOM65313.1 ribosomal protein L35 [Thorea hispida]ARX95873.1 ribosomal protein L35 [Thorea hispida]UNJ79158.1 ribosomal protein L35 [Thorea hispida]